MPENIVCHEGELPDQELFTERELAFEHAVAFIEARAEQYRQRGHETKDDDVAKREFERAVTCDFMAEDMRAVYLGNRKLDA